MQVGTASRRHINYNGLYQYELRRYTDMNNSPCPTTHNTSNKHIQRLEDGKASRRNK